MGLLIQLFWASDDVCSGFQSQGGSLTWVLRHLHAMDSSDSPLVQHLLTSWQPAWRPSRLRSTYLNTYMYTILYCILHINRTTKLLFELKLQLSERVHKNLLPHILSMNPKFNIILRKRFVISNDGIVCRRISLTVVTQLSSRGRSLNRSICMCSIRCASQIYPVSLSLRMCAKKFVL